MKPEVVIFGEFDVPKDKRGLLKYLVGRYPEDRNKLEHKKTRELYGMYYRIRRAE